MKVYARSLLVGLCAAAVVLVVCWSLALGPRVVYTPVESAPSLPPPAPTPSGGYFSELSVIKISEGYLTMPWYVGVLAGLALVTASGWQLRRSWRDRR
jgi:hypothetical protein